MAEAISEKDIVELLTQIVMEIKTRDDSISYSRAQIDALEKKRQEANETVSAARRYLEQANRNVVNIRLKQAQREEIDKAMSKAREIINSVGGEVKRLENRRDEFERDIKINEKEKNELLSKAQEWKKELEKLGIRDIEHKLHENLRKFGINKFYI